MLPKLNKKLDHIGLAQAIAHKGKVPYEQVIFPSAYLEGASLDYLHSNFTVANNKKRKRSSTTCTSIFRVIFHKRNYFQAS